jgi:hypothetical protein
MMNLMTNPIPLMTISIPLMTTPIFLMTTPFVMRSLISWMSSSTARRAVRPAEAVSACLPSHAPRHRARNCPRSDPSTQTWRRRLPRPQP